MKLTREEVKHIADLARLAITPEEKELFADQLSIIIDYFSRLNELNTDDVQPFSVQENYKKNDPDLE